MPAMTGDTANGRSISVINRLRPGKRNFAMAQPAATPNTRFAGTEMLAASRVSLTAASASSLVIAA